MKRKLRILGTILIILGVASLALVRRDSLPANPWSAQSGPPASGHQVAGAPAPVKLLSAASSRGRTGPEWSYYLLALPSLGDNSDLALTPSQASGLREVLKPLLASERDLREQEQVLPMLLAEAQVRRIRGRGAQAGPYYLLAPVDTDSDALVGNVKRILRQRSGNRSPTGETSAGEIPAGEIPARVSPSSKEPIPFSDISWGLLELEGDDRLCLTPTQAAALLAPYNRAAADYTRLQNIPRLMARILNRDQMRHLEKPGSFRGKAWKEPPLDGALKWLESGAGARE